MANHRQWRRAALAFCATFFGLLAGLIVAIIAIDPYDTGYFPSVIGGGVSDTNEQTNIASRARDQHFAAAVFGNSHGQLLNPYRLAKLTGVPFIQLFSAGTGPKEQMMIMRYFLRRHPDVRVIVLTADMSWCTHDPKIPRPFTGLPPFPGWLYSENRWRYLAHTLNSGTLRRMQHRVAVAFGFTSRVDAVGYVDYEIGRPWHFAPPPFTRVAASTATSAAPTDAYFPAIDRVDDLFSGLMRDVIVIVAMPPVYIAGLPSDPAGMTELNACKSALSRVAAKHHGRLVDFLVDSEISRDPTQFMDDHHMRGSVARLIEDQIAAAIE